MSLNECSPLSAISAAVGLVAAIGAACTLMAASRERAAAQHALEILERSLPRLNALMANQHGGLPFVQRMPTKYALSHVTPVARQLERGTCWMFAAVSLLEQSYRVQGVEHGWLQANEYLKISEQAFGIAVMDACAVTPAPCVYDGDMVWTGNSTEGGEVPLVYYLTVLGKTSVLPDAVCPYAKSDVLARKCDGLEAARAHSTLRFRVNAMRTYYDLDDVKAALVAGGRELAMSTTMVNVRYYLPCSELTAPLLGCDPDGEQCEPCPLERAFVGVRCCIASDRPMTTMGGEFYRLDSPLILEGGHAMAVVGYSDTFVTEHGMVGGLILKNSWWDGLPPSASWKGARGSHSIDYFMGRISSTDELATCPNVHSPRSWQQCPDAIKCRDHAMKLYARAARKVLRLRCLDHSAFVKGVCREGEAFFLKNLSAWGGDLSVACLVHALISYP